MEINANPLSVRLLGSFNRFSFRWNERERQIVTNKKETTRRKIGEQNHVVYKWLCFNAILLIVAGTYINTLLFIHWCCLFLFLIQSSIKWSCKCIWKNIYRIKREHDFFFFMCKQTILCNLFIHTHFLVVTAIAFEKIHFLFIIFLVLIYYLWTVSDINSWKRKQLHVDTKKPFERNGQN